MRAFLFPPASVCCFHHRSPMPRFCIALFRGQPCPAGLSPVSTFAVGHLTPSAPVPRPCGYINPKGEPCRAFALRGQDHCFVHSPRNHRAKQPLTPLSPIPVARRPTLNGFFSDGCHTPNEPSSNPRRINHLPHTWGEGRGGGGVGDPVTCTLHPAPCTLHPSPCTCTLFCCQPTKDCATLLSGPKFPSNCKTLRRIQL